MELRCLLGIFFPPEAQFAKNMRKCESQKRPSAAECDRARPSAAEGNRALPRTSERLLPARFVFCCCQLGFFVRFSFFIIAKTNKSRSADNRAPNFSRDFRPTKRYGNESVAEFVIRWALFSAKHQVI